MNEDIFLLADALKNLRQEKQQLEAELKAVNERLDEANYKLAERMAETETQNFTRSGTLFCLTNTTRASAVAGNKEALYMALRAHGFGDLVYETVNANSLSSFVRERIEENDDALPDWLSGLVNVFEKTTVGVRNATR